MEEIYISEVVLALIRIGICVFILYGLLASLMNPGVKEEPFENRLIFNWTCFSGFLISGVLGLVLSNLYDLFGVIILIAAVLLIRSALTDKDSMDQLYGEPRETQGDQSGSKRFLIWQLKMIEKVRLFFTSSGSSDTPIKRPRLMNISNTDNRWKYAVISIAGLGAILRLYPALQSPVPSNSNWFFVVQKVKNIRLQRLFADIPEPPGFYALISFFTSISQVKPELIVHFLEALLTIPVCLLVYWGVFNIISKETPAGVRRFSSLFAMAVYAIAPVMVFQGSLVHEIHHSKINAALTVAVPAIYGFWHLEKKGIPRKLFFWGVLATTLIDIFVFVNIMLPLLLMVALYSSYSAEGMGKLLKPGVLLLTTLAVVGFYGGIVIYYGLDYKEFILWQLYNPQVYDTFSGFIMRHPELAQGYLIAGGAAILFYLVSIIRGANKLWGEALLSAGFMLLLLLYYPTMNVSLEWVDTRQFFYVFTLILALFWGIAMVNLARLARWSVSIKDKAQRSAALFVMVIAVFGFAFTQYELGNYEPGEQTIPEGFFDSYYQIVEERVPYSYTIVAPTVMQIMSQNRNYFIEYNFFLNNFAQYDSLYYQKVAQINKPIPEIDFEYRPSPSVFIFVAKSPFNFQINNIDNITTIMPRLASWVEQYKTKEDREISVFHESEDAVVYELSYETGTSKLDETIYEVYTEKPWPMYE